MKSIARLEQIQDHRNRMSFWFGIGDADYTTRLSVRHSIAVVITLSLLGWIAIGGAIALLATILPL
ncbi:MAG: hypothetical protein GKS00_11305 [Alphaproteobacteria bacterium]|nr:hypothetical protein [Alphaproteobacteria bacterium]